MKQEILFSMIVHANSRIRLWKAARIRRKYASVDKLNALSDRIWHEQSIAPAVL